MDINNLLHSLDNDTNEGILHLTTSKIVEMNISILKELHLDINTTRSFLKKIVGYRYIDELDELKYGAFIRWIPIIDPTNIILTHTGMICDVKIVDNGVLVVCKNFRHKHYTFKMDECLIFQKLNSQELILLSALDHLIDK
jgi:hypothetical protein